CRRLAPFSFRLGRLGAQVWPNGGVLRVEIGHVRHEVLDHRHVRQRIDFHRARYVGDGLGAGERVAAADVHRARTAHALPAGAAEGQGRVDLVLDLDEAVQNHRPAGCEINRVYVDT